MMLNGKDWNPFNQYPQQTKDKAGLCIHQPLMKVRSWLFRQIVFQQINRSLVEKFGSLVRLTPSRRRPASSPGVGMCVIWTSQPRSSLSFSTAIWAAGFVAALILRAMRVSRRSKLSVFSLRTSVLRFLTDSIIKGGSSLISSGIPVRCLAA